MVNIKEIVKDNFAYFLYIRKGKAYYQIHVVNDVDVYGVIFPIELADLEDATLNAKEKAITLMRYVRKAIETDNLVILDKLSEEKKFEIRFKKMVDNGLKHCHISWADELLSGERKLTREEAFAELNAFQDAVEDVTKCEPHVFGDATRDPKELVFNDSKKKVVERPDVF